MNYLKSLFLHSIYFFKVYLLREIPRIIGGHEIFVRCILHPLFFKKKLTRNAFLPPPDKNDVSLLRLSFTNPDFCKSHAKKIVIPENKYCGLATIKHCIIKEIFNDKNLIVKAKIKATPLTDDFNLIKRKRIFKNEKGIPMHADLIYDKPLTKGEPATEHRIIADAILKVANYFPDTNINNEKWTSGKLGWTKPTDNSQIKNEK